jgi:hypothetical protein
LVFHFKVNATGLILGNAAVDLVSSMVGQRKACSTHRTVVK